MSKAPSSLEENMLLAGFSQNGAKNLISAIIEMVGVAFQRLKLCKDLL
jgi:hypothetical protein